MQEQNALAGPSTASSSTIPPGEEVLTAALSSSTEQRRRRQRQRTLNIDDGETSTREHYTSRVRDRRLQLSNPDRPRPKADRGSVAERKLKQRRKRCDTRSGSRGGAPASADGASSTATPPTLSRTARRHRGLEGLDAEMSHAALLPLHDLWQSYIQQFLGLVQLVSGEEGAAAEGATVIPNDRVLELQRHDSSPPSSSWQLKSSAIAAVQAQACKADLLGASLSVVRSANPSLVGVDGLVAKETEGTFVIALAGGGNDGEARLRRRRPRFVVVPKQNTTFVLKVPLPAVTTTTTTASPPPSSLQIPLMGNQLVNTMVTRAVKKWKARRTMDYA